MIPRLHLTTDDATLSRGDFLPRARQVLATGGRDLVLHIRGPRSPGRTVYGVAAALKEAAADSGSILLANDRVDVALVLGLSGAHLGQRSLPPGVARGLLGGQGFLGLSVHHTTEVPEGEEEALDYLIVGTIFPSSSHPGASPGGPDLLKEVAEVSSLPLVGIGGITPRRVASVVAAGAYGVAVRSGIWDSEDPGEATRSYLEELNKGGRE